MALTVGDIRRSLSKYSDDTIVADYFGDDFSPCSSCAPVSSIRGFRVSSIPKSRLINNSWCKADLSNKKVVSIEYDPEYSDEFYSADINDACKYWKKKNEEHFSKISDMKPLSEYLSGEFYY